MLLNLSPNAIQKLVNQLQRTETFITKGFYGRIEPQQLVQLPLIF